MWILQILVGLLKIIGMVLLGIFCILLLLVLLILFGAIRYEVEGSAKNRESTGQVLLETLHVNAKVSWLNPLFRVLVQVRGKKVAYQVKVFGFCVLDSEKPKKEKPTKPKKAKKEKEPKETVSNVAAENEVQVQQEASGKEEKKEETALGDITSAGQDTKEQKEPNEVVESGQETTQPNPETQTTESGLDDNPVQTQPEEPAENASSGNQKKKKKATKEKKAASEEAGEKKKFDLEKLQETVLKIKEKKDLVMEFLHEETTKKTVAGTFRTIKKVILHILPVSIRGNIIYGSGDPASTGKAFAVLGILYAKYGESLTVLGDFEEKRLEAELQIKGRIRLGVMAWYFISFVLKKETRAFMKRCMQLIKKLKA